MITYYWTIDSLGAYPEYDGEQDVVFVIYATYYGTDGTYTEGVKIAQSLIIDANEPFTPYPDLTEDQVTGWLLAALTPSQIDQMQISIQAKINADNKPPFVQLPLPWSN
jgi:hypothetical protein